MPKVLSRIRKKSPSPRSLSVMPTIDYAICDLLVLTRRQAGQTQEMFAAELGITLSLLKHIETKRILPNLYIIQQWHHKFKKSYGWIIDGQ